MRQIHVLRLFSPNSTFEKQKSFIFMKSNLSILSFIRSAMSYEIFAYVQIMKI